MEKDFIDVLERNKFVEKLENIIQNTDISKKGRCFALNGEWGAGKSIVVDMLIEKYDNKQDYFIIKYNAWENDFYEEPLIAMVSVIKKTVLRKKTKEIKQKEEQDIIENSKSKRLIWPDSKCQCCGRDSSK